MLVLAGGDHTLRLRSRAEWVASLADALSRGLGLVGLLTLGLLLVVGERTHHPVFSSRDQCGTDPMDILRAGEVLDPGSLHFIVAAHCSNARFLPDGWIELRYGGGRIDVETRRLEIAGAIYYQIVSVGGMAAW